MYKRGQEVLRCQPFSYMVKSSYRSRVCDFCLQIKDGNETSTIKTFGGSPRIVYVSISLNLKITGILQKQLVSVSHL